MTIGFLKARRDGVEQGKYVAESEEARRLSDTRHAELKVLRELPIPVGAESGWVSNFDDRQLSSRFGMGWKLFTDEGFGGRSSASVTAVAGGAGGSAGAMRILGRVEDNRGPRFAGASFDPGGPVNLSRFGTIELRVRGTPGRHLLMLFTASTGPAGVKSMFELPEQGTGQWTQVSVELADLGVEALGLVSVFVGADEVGAFELFVDDVRFR